MEFVVLYRLKDGVDHSRILQTYPRHKAYYEAFFANGGGLTALGPFRTPDTAAGSMGIFTSRDDADRFIAGDPFVIEGLAEPRILEWNVVRLK